MIYTLSKIYPTPFLKNLEKVFKKYQYINFDDAFSNGQIESKLWLIDELKKLNINLGTVFVLGSWYGVLPALMFDKECRVNKIRGFDIDPTCAEIADTLNKDPFVINNWKFKASTADMYKLNYSKTSYVTQRYDKSEVALEDIPDTIINCSCEHLEFFDEWWNLIPIGKLVVLQSNNFPIKEHVNWKYSLDEFSSSAPMSEILFSGELDLNVYTRFMIIGRK